MYLDVTEPIDREKYSELKFHIEVEDGGEPVQRNTLPVVVTVNDVNDNSPVIKPNFYNTEVSFSVNSSRFMFP